MYQQSVLFTSTDRSQLEVGKDQRKRFCVVHGVPRAQLPQRKLPIVAQ